MTISQYTAEVDAVTAGPMFPAASEEFLQLVATYKSKLMTLATTCYSNAIAAREYSVGPQIHTVQYVLFGDSPQYTEGISVAVRPVSLSPLGTLDLVNLALNGSSLGNGKSHVSCGYVVARDEFDSYIESSKPVFHSGSFGKVDAVQVTSRVILSLYHDDVRFSVDNQVQPYHRFSSKNLLHPVGLVEPVEKRRWNTHYRCGYDSAELGIDGWRIGEEVRMMFQNPNLVEENIARVVQYDLSPFGRVAPVGLLTLHHLKKVGNLLAAEVSAAKRRAEMLTGLIDEL